VQFDPSAFHADPELIQALQKLAVPLPCDDDLVLFRQGDNPAGLHILNQGEALITMAAPTGEVILSAQATAGSLLGLPGLVGNHPYSLTAVARRGSQISFISRDDFNALMETDTTLSFKILQVLAAEVRTARMAISQL
jgi:CRP-like cAMP-binding protein